MTKDNIKVTADRFRFMMILIYLNYRHQEHVVGVIGHNVSMIFQEPQSCLDPATKIEHQLIQAIPGWTFKGHWWQRFHWRNAVQIELLHRVGIKDHKDIMRSSYPYELTEGECQK